MGETEKRIETHRIRCLSKLKMFLLAITCAYVSKTLSGSYMNSMLTQIERQFNIPTSLVGFINGSFEIECVKEVKSLMWVYVLVGNIIRGIGETPIMPLGISYIEDFAKSENSPLYIGFIETGAIIGPLIGLSLASFCANVYVDTGSVNTDDLTITPIDTRWVGAWWFGFLVCAGVNVLTAIPFFVLPKTLPKEGLEDIAETIKNDKEEKQSEVRKKSVGITKDFLPFMKSLLCNPVYMLFILISVLQFNAFVNMISFMPKYLEQHYGKSASDAIFLIGIYNLPPICIGYIVGGLIMKKFKITVIQAAHIGCWLSLIEYLLYFLCFLMICDNSSVAGITTSYEGVQQDLHVGNGILADCNMDCNCPTKIWDPVCGNDGLSYMSACLAGCETSSGTGINMVFQNCSCIQTPGNSSAVLGLCDKGQDCSMMLQYFLILSVVSSFIYSLSAIPGYMVLLRCIKPEEKSLGVGLHAFCTRVLAGIPAPIYFGALVDSTCLHWGTLKCGESGACRIYDSTNFRYIYLGLPAVLRGSSYIPAFLILIILRKYRLPEENASSETMLEAKFTGKENEGKETDQNSKVLNDDELKTKL
ncbi:solute carrier organic anion transporter family member 1A2 isoform X3 [Globicephala melas]|uniref:solute carrier organic anion transporter family member 1A2 isoform X3 n=1 Tax=Globicephala melas TaxID=9731 RepID=UPI00293D20A4|nr:solute carrier organic anion transporter family member 1A2 isoform X3 [Globicephala melas]